MTSSRRLVAIMFADIVGYTAIMGRDEKAALKILDENRNLLRPMIEKHNGTWLKELGDGVLASFSTASEATRCAIEIQKASAAIEGLTLRIGLHLGEVVFDHDDVFGDGVNLASRISDAAPPGKIWISDTLRMSIRNQKAFNSSFVKDMDLKNVDEKIRIYEIGAQGQNKAKRPLLKLNWLRNFLLLVTVSVALLIVVYLIKNGEPDSIYETVTVENELGLKETREIVKPEHITQIPIFYFNQEEPDSVNAWLGQGIAIALGNDLDQDEHINVLWPQPRGGIYRYIPTSLNSNNSYSTLVDKIREAEKWQYKNFLTGAFRVYNDTFHITTLTYEMPSGKVSAQHAYKGNNFFEIIDQISRQVKVDFDIPSDRIDNGRDAPIADLSTSNFEAFHHFILAYLNFPGQYLFENYRKCLEIDSTFAFASYNLARHIHVRGEGRYASIKAIERSIRHINRMPEILAMEAKALYYNIFNDEEKAHRIFKMQHDLNPGQLGFTFNLYKQNMMMGKYEENIALVDDKDFPSRELLGFTHIFNGNYKEAQSIFINLNEETPNDVNYLFGLRLALGLSKDFEKVEMMKERELLENPLQKTNLYRDSLEMAVKAYATSNSPNPEAIEKISGVYRRTNKEDYYEVYNYPGAHGIFSVDKGGAWQFALPISDYEYMTIENVITYLKNEDNKVYKVRYDAPGRKNPIYDFKQDASIWEAEELLRTGRNKLALEAFRKLFDDNPDHYYLANYIKYLEFISDPEFEKISSDFSRYTGKYGHLTVSYSNGKLHISSLLFPEGILLPLTKNTFQAIESYKYQIRFIEKGSTMSLQWLERVEDEYIIFWDFEKED